MKFRRVLSAFTAVSMLLTGAFSVTAHADDDDISYKITYSSKYTYLELTPSDDDNIIRYTTDGSVPDEDSKVYKKRLRTSKSVTLRIAEFDEDGDKVDTLKVKLKRKCMKAEISTEKVSGGYEVTLTTKTDGAVIYYTTDGSKPTKDSEVYNEPFKVEEGDVVRAFVTKSGWKNSSYIKKTIKNAAEDTAAAAEVKSDENDYDETALEIFELVNKYREENGLGELKMDKVLYEAAQIRAAEIAKKYSHTRPDGNSWATVFDDVGFKYSFGGENIAYTEGSLSRSATVMKMWMDSPGHRENILNTSGDLIGIAAYKIGNTTYWVQLFGERR